MSAERRGALQSPNRVHAPAPNKRMNRSAHSLLGRLRLVSRTRPVILAFGGFQAHNAMKCPYCGEIHDFDDLEVGFDLPDDVFAIPEPERSSRSRSTPDLCVLDDERYFLRGVLDFPCDDRRTPFGVGLWVETSKQSYDRYVELYSDPDQGNEPPFCGTIANTLDGYWDLRGVPVSIQLVSANERPSLVVTDPTHPAAHDQTQGVPAETLYELLWSNLHPDEPETPPN
jgi:hypothetical protein